jgi:DNA polymerase III subunit delta'
MAYSVEQALQYLVTASQRGRLAHTFLFSGSSHGSQQLVHRFYQEVNQVDQSKRHPDFHLVEPESKSRRILVEQIRDLEAQLRMRAGEVRWKFGVVDDADRMMPQAANAFLKTLEEPPEHSILVLLTTLPEALLDTIRSRCIHVPIGEEAVGMLEPESERFLQELVLFFSVSKSSLADVIGLARSFQGVLSDVREVIQEEHQAEMKREEEIYKQTTDGKWLQTLEERLTVLTESRYVKTRSKLVTRISEWFGDALRLRNGHEHLDLPQFRSALEAVANRFSSQQLLERLAAVESLNDYFSKNIQEALAIEVAFIKAFS